MFRRFLLQALWVGLACAGLAATGWIIGRWNRSHPIATVIVFAFMIAFWNFGLVPAINIPWLFRLTVDSFENPRFLQSLLTATATHALLLGSLFTGALLTRAHEEAFSLGLRQADKMDNRE